MERYAIIHTILPREFVLLQGTGCRWKKCTFCDYHADVSDNPFAVNKGVLAQVQGVYGVLDYEADLLIMNKTGYVTEIEIKRSWSDFLADFKKDEKAHKAEIIYQFWYCVPDEIYNKCVEKLKEVYPNLKDSNQIEVLVENTDLGVG